MTTPTEPAAATEATADVQWRACAFDQLSVRELNNIFMEGKTAWELGSILGISERTAVLHINNATHKLGCINKHQAVLKALRLGVIR